MKKDKQELPKIIWFLWFQGLKKAPYVVKKCLASWKIHNPEWKVIFLSEKSIKEYINLEEIMGENYQYASKQALSDIIRINLLKKYGGVWVDSTCFCCKPLDSWLNNYMTTDFFAFYRPNIDKPISSWFLVSYLDSQLTSKYCEETNLYWSKNCFSNQKNKIAKFCVKRITRVIKNISYKLPGFFTFFLLTKPFKVYPYFWFHYIFVSIIKTDKSCHKEWEAMNKYSASIPHKLSHYGFFNPLSEQIKSYIDKKKAPLYKLTWKYDESNYKKDCTLYYLLEQ